MTPAEFIRTDVLAVLHAVADERVSWTSDELVAEVLARMNPPQPSSVPEEDGPYKKRAIPLAARREVALRYGCPPGGSIRVGCHYCDKPGEIYWYRLFSGRPSCWVTSDHE